MSRRYSGPVSQFLFPAVAVSVIMFVAVQVATDVLASLEPSLPAKNGACDLSQNTKTEDMVMHLVHTENARRLDEGRFDPVMRLTQCLPADPDADYVYAYDVPCSNGIEPVIAWNMSYDGSSGRIDCLGTSAP